MARAADAEIGAQIRHIRTGRGMTRPELGRRIGLTPQQVENYETGASAVSVRRLWQIGQVLGVPVAAFFEGLAGDELARARAARELAVSREALSLAGYFLTLPCAQRQRLFDLARTLRASA